jgi:hypothetical protein
MLPEGPRVLEKPKKLRIDAKIFEVQSEIILIGVDRSNLPLIKGDRVLTLQSKAYVYDGDIPDTRYTDSRFDGLHIRKRCWKETQIDDSFIDVNPKIFKELI